MIVFKFSFFISSNRSHALAKTKNRPEHNFLVTKEIRDLGFERTTKIGNLFFLDVVTSATRTRLKVVEALFFLSLRLRFDLPTILFRSRTNFDLTCLSLSLSATHSSNGRTNRNGDNIRQAARGLDHRDRCKRDNQSWISMTASEREREREREERALSLCHARVRAQPDSSPTPSSLPPPPRRRSWLSEMDPRNFRGSKWSCNGQPRPDSPLEGSREEPKTWQTPPKTKPKTFSNKFDEKPLNLNLIITSLAAAAAAAASSWHRSIKIHYRWKKGNIFKAERKKLLSLNDNKSGNREDVWIENFFSAGRKETNDFQFCFRQQFEDH